MTRAIVFLPVSSGVVGIIDFEDIEKVRTFKWGLGGYCKRYVCRKGKRTSEGRPTVYLHREVLPTKSTVDHIDGNPLNNCRENLRAATAHEQSVAFQRKRENTSSRFRGVMRVKFSERWEAFIKIGKKTTYLGRHPDEITAAKVRDAAAKALFGPRAALNFP